MKLFSALFVALFSLPVLASLSPYGFQSTSPIPLGLQAEIVETIKDRCPEVFTSFEEIRTLVREDEVDQGVRDQYFTTELRGLVEVTEPEYHTVIVESALYAIENPQVKNTELIDVLLPIAVCE